MSLSSKERRRCSRASEKKETVSSLCRLGGKRRRWSVVVLLIFPFHFPCRLSNHASCVTMSEHRNDVKETRLVDLALRHFSSFPPSFSSHRSFRFFFLVHPRNTLSDAGSTLPTHPDKRSTSPPPHLVRLPTRPQQRRNSTGVALRG
jgi:hypothetical protein